ncbi:hypothetical protein C5167_025779 [Papaver somniferum]|uniref:Uncharacterized protein n=1 Tax=Papaver somniferum TaxID=3469 RepID=A0A4Y7JVF2_PAPSO|nr:hypothetical protein C5167_025779 [Papaver somniferum]
MDEFMKIKSVSEKSENLGRNSGEANSIQLKGFGSDFVNKGRAAKVLLTWLTIDKSKRKFGSVLFALPKGTLRLVRSGKKSRGFMIRLSDVTDLSHG